ncbi:glycosyltransferase [Dokdonia sp. Hel_I_53]|uniref:glycosyltransferase n=1 Tax=Dokdonia sp. Hel_I_53 TaxID=1566287 RepID=UPI00119A49C4|nr:glycosyltransferase [Dokdonia sp. Hel_I_53]TVZ53434.1 glycosyltransferase involved in cell wall biosynthesis [Dokdonia sp. Hel_I_53]
MPKDTHKKIALVTISLSGGGAERSTAMLSRMLVSQGFKVHIITLNDEVSYEYAGVLYNMGLEKNKGDNFLKRIARFMNLSKYLKNENFDFIIDNRSRNNVLKEWIYLHYIYRNHNLIYVNHSSLLSNYFTSNQRLSEKMAHSAVGLIGVSQHITEAINSNFKVKKAKTIFNPIENVETIEHIDSKHPYFIFVGRIEDKVKNLSLLIHAFAKAKKENYHLRIYGDGSDKNKMHQLVKTLNMESRIKFYPFQQDITNEIASARALLLTSHYEGFPRALIESLSVGTPVISVNCVSGPAEIITNNHNGLLVENHNEDKFSNAIESFIFDEQLYMNCKSNAKNSVSHLSLVKIAQEWSNYITSL